jgi:hypothetical protein
MREETESALDANLYFRRAVARYSNAVSALAF